MLKKSRVLTALMTVIMLLGMVTVNPTDASAEIGSSGFLKTSGTLIKDNNGTGSVVNLRGTNLGGWLLQESWMSPLGATDEWTLRETLTNRFGESITESLINTYQSAWLTTAGLDNNNANAVPNIYSDSASTIASKWQKITTANFSANTAFQNMVKKYTSVSSTPPPSGTNLALNKPVTFSGQQAGNEAIHAVDGDISNRWSSQVFPQWITVDLGDVYNINATEVVPYMDRAYQFRVEVSTDGTNYSQIVDRTANTTGDASIANTFTGTNARYVKLTVTGCYNEPTDWTSINEFRVFGDTATPPPSSEPETVYSYLTARANQSIVCAENYGDDPLIANRTSAGGWESFQIINNSDGTISLLSKVNGKYVCADLNQSAKLIARSSTIDTWEKFQKVTQADGTIALKAMANDQYVCCDLNLGAVLYANRADVGGAWETFTITNVNDTDLPPETEKFVHPGLLSSQQDLDFMKAQVNSSTGNATKDGYNKMISDFRASTTYKPTAYETVTVLGSGSTTSEDSYRNDAHAAYANALRWVITGNPDNRDKSIQILNAWSYKFKSLANNNQPNQPTLEASWALPIWVSAAEIMRHYNNGAAGWSQADINQFETFVDRQLAYVKGNAYDAPNWKSSIALAIMAAGVFEDDQSLYDDGYNRMVTEIGKIGSDGKLPETDRDFVHAQYGLIGMAQGAEIAFQQGKGDLYGKKYNGESKPRLLLGSEYFVQCLLGTPVNGGPNYASNTKHNPPYEMILTRYKYDYNMAVPKTELFVTSQNRSTDLWENHFVGWTTLTHANLP
ncbi:MAG: discoidin domain-containing protein [Anaerocolumna sp.]